MKQPLFKSKYFPNMVSLSEVAVKVVDLMTYSPDKLKLIVNDCVHAGRFIKFRVGRLSEEEMKEMSRFYDKYFPAVKPAFIEKDGFWQADIVSECHTDDYYVYDHGTVHSGTIWQRTKASISFKCNSDYCNRWKRKHGLNHEYPSFTPFPFDKYKGSDYVPEPEWLFVE